MYTIYYTLPKNTKKYGHSRTVVHLHLNERNVCSTTSREWIGLPKEGRSAVTRFLAGVRFVPRFVPAVVPGGGSGSLWWMNERFWKVSMTKSLSLMTRKWQLFCSFLRLFYYELSLNNDIMTKWQLFFRKKLFENFNNKKSKKVILMIIKDKL